MTKTNQDFEMWSGDHADVTFKVKDKTGASVNVSGASVVFVISDEPDTASIVKLSTDSGCGITTSGCTYLVSLSPTHTSTLNGFYHHESQMTDSNGNISTVAVGTVKVNFDVVQ